MSQERVSGFPEKGADLQGRVAGELRGKCGELTGNFVKFHSERTSGEVARQFPGKFGKVRGLSRSWSLTRSLPPQKNPSLGLRTTLSC